MKKLFVLIILFISIIMLSTVSFAQDKPVISFTFDDGHISVIKNVLPLFEEYDIQGTVYIITGKVGSCDYYMNWNQINALFKNGWEIGAHTHTHPYLTKISNKKAIFELDESIKILKEHGFNPISFATPYGDFNNKIMKLVKKRFQSHRTAWDDDFINKNNENGLNIIKDPYYISIFEFKNTTTVDEAKKMVDLTIKNKTWLVFLLHSVKKNGEIREWDYDIKKLEQVVKYIIDKKVKILTLSNALKIK